MKNQFLKSLLTAALLVFHLPSSAEDIDLFVGAGAATTADVPNVLFIVDNTANWNQEIKNEFAALANTVVGLPVDKFRVGIMFSAETGNPNNNTSGGYVRAAIRLMNVDNKPKYQALINSFSSTDKSNGGKSSLVMAEAYRYLSGGTAYAGDGKAKADYVGNINTGTTAQDKAVYALPGNALPSNALSGNSNTKYVSPIAPGCAKNYIIYLSNGAPKDNSTVIGLAEGMLTDVSGSITQIPISPSGSQNNVSDEWARFMKQSSLGVITYTVDINKDSTGQGPGWTALLKSMANVSGGKYFSISSSTGTAEVSNALQQIFSEIQSVNSVFAAVSLPVSVNTQGTYLNQVYIGMFRPDGNASPRWAGNLKQYKLGFIGNELQLLDAENKSAINNNTGFITECARSFWTPTSDDTYWTNFTNANCVGRSASSNTPDGNLVEKGGQGYKLRSITPSLRTVKTCSSIFASCTSLTDFNTANAAITQAQLGPTVDATERDALINWARGLNNNGDEATIVAATEMRPSAHGDVVHSRPAAINFGIDGAPKVVVFYGGNDGVLRAINGNRDGGLSIGSVAPGNELWAFIAPESFGNIKRLRDNTTPISFKGSASGTPKPYGFDGPVTSYKDSSQTWIYATMRRGGRMLYAFDVTIPQTPTLKWKQGCNDTDCTAGFEGIGQTWSSPKTLKSSGYGTGASPMLIMGGGYDACEDADPNNCSTSSTPSNKGNHIYVLDADTGVMLKTLDTDRGVVGDISIVPDSSGMAQYAYAADLGGNVYRISGTDPTNPDSTPPIGSTAPADWKITKIASLGCATPTVCSANRKFMFGPSVVADNDGIYRLLLGSGDREKPLTSYSAAAAVPNYFFMIKDKPSDSSWVTLESPSPTGNGNCSESVICMNSLFGITTTANPTQAQLDGKPKGWYLGLAAQEQVVTSAITLYGVVSFSTHQPAVPVSGSCSSNLGIAKSYDIAYTNAAGANAASANGTDQRYELITGGGLSPSPVGGMVTLDNGQTVPFLIKGIKPTEPPVPLGSTPIQPKSRVYWYIQQ